MLLHTTTLIFAIFAALMSYWNSIRGEVELFPFAASRITAAVLPPAFPANNSYSPALFRKLFTVATLTLEQSPRIYSTDVYIDDVVPGDFRLLRVYNAGTNGNLQRDVMVFFFAGAWMLGSVDHNDRICKNLAHSTEAVVVCAEYSLAPEHVFPRGFNDAVAALRWTKRNIARYGGNPNRIFVTGESAGGNLAAAVTAHNLDDQYTSHEERVNIVGLLLVYPPTAANFSTESYIKYANYNGMLPKSEMEHAWRMYAGGQVIDPADYRYQPFYAPDHLLAQFPPTVVVVAEYDVLRDDSLMLADRLRAAGSIVDVTIYPTIHGFFCRDISTWGAKALPTATTKLLELSRPTS